MVLVLLIIAFVIASTLLVIAAGILSSRLSRQEEWYETYEAVEAESAETIPQTTE
jgi:hypothetical protein